MAKGDVRGILTCLASAEDVMNDAGHSRKPRTQCFLFCWALVARLGYLPFSASGGALLFHLLSKLYERTSVIITTNPSVPTMLRQSPAGSLPLRAEVETSHGYASYH